MKDDQVDHSTEVPGGDADQIEPAASLRSESTAANLTPLQGETVTFTGTLASMTHREAMDRVEQSGGRAVTTVTNSTTLLVIGEEGWPLEEDGQASQKVRQAAQRIADGHNLRIIAESDWLQILGLDDRQEEIQRAYTPAMLSRLLNISVGMIRRWARLGLIRPVRRVCRLPYFDYREVAGARRLAAMLEQGISPQILEQSLGELGRTLNSSGRSLTQLNLLVHDENVLVRDACGMLIPRTGQRLLDFESTTDLRLVALDDDSNFSDDNMTALDSAPAVIAFQHTDSPTCTRTMSDWNADEWFHEGCRLAEDGELESAINSLRNSLSLVGAQRATMGTDPVDSELLTDPADIHFHLADALYRSGRAEAAIERYYCAIESAPDFVEAWTQLGCLQAETNDLAAAEQSLSTALQIHSGNPDALLHFALLLDHTSRADQARKYWKQYLRFDTRGPWSEHARDRLQAGIPNDVELLVSEPSDT